MKGNKHTAEEADYGSAERQERMAANNKNQKQNEKREWSCGQLKPNSNRRSRYGEGE